MKRLHIHLSVKDLDKNIQFYTTMFQSEPKVVKSDYVKWELEEPAVNFAISNRDNKEGLNHLGIQTDQDDELQEMAEQLEHAEVQLTKQEETACCYSKSNKHWSFDPQGIPWECFNTLSDIPTFGESEPTDQNKKSGSSCTPSINWSKISNSSSCC